MHQSFLLLYAVFGGNGKLTVRVQHDREYDNGPNFRRFAVPRRPDLSRPNSKANSKSGNANNLLRTARKTAQEPSRLNANRHVSRRNLESQSEASPALNFRLRTEILLFKPDE